MSTIHIVLTVFMTVGMLGGVIASAVAPTARVLHIVLAGWTLAGCAALAVALLWVGDLVGLAFGAVTVIGTLLAVEQYTPPGRKLPARRVYAHTTRVRPGLEGHTATVETLPADCVTAFGAPSIHNAGKRAIVERFDGGFVRILWIAPETASDTYVEETAAAYLAAQVQRHARDRAEMHMVAGAGGQEEPDWYASCPRCTQLAGVEIEWPCATAVEHGLDRVREPLAPVDEATFAETSPF